MTTLRTRGGPILLGTGIVLKTMTAELTLWFGYRLLKIPMSLLIGMLAGLQTSPAVLSDVR